MSETGHAHAHAAGVSPAGAPPHVAVHTDSGAVRFLQQHQAVAATLDAGTVFVRPEFAGSRAVLSHEFAHILQLRSGRSTSRESAESAAERYARDASGDPGAGAPPPLFQRLPPGSTNAQPGTTSQPQTDAEGHARSILDLHEKYRADVAGLTQLGLRLQTEFSAAGTKPSLVRRAAATELVRVFHALEKFESALPRGPGGILMQKTPFNPRPAPWPGRPRSLQQIAPFSPAHVQEWQAAAKEPGAPLPAPTPRPIPSGPSRVIRPAVADDSFDAHLIKVPGMSLATKAGQTRILADVLRVFSHQALSDANATPIATHLELWKYLVLDFGDTVEHKTQALETLPLGHEYRVKLHKTFLQDAQKRVYAGLKLDASQRMTADLGNTFSREYMPDNSDEERFWYAVERMKSTTRDRDSGYLPDQVVSSDGVKFVGPGVGESVFLAPDGKLYVTKQATLHAQQLEAVRIGVVESAGGVILAWATVAAGVAALAGPEIVAAYESLSIYETAAGVYARVLPMFERILYHRLTVWLGANWHVVLAKLGFSIGLGHFATNFDVRAFARRFRNDPSGAVADLTQQIAPILLDAMEASVSGSPSATRGSSRAPDAAEPDLEPQPPAAPAARAQPQTDESLAISPSSQVSAPPIAPPAPASDTTLKTMIVNAQLKTRAPANINAAQATSQAAQIEEVQDQALQSTGTDARGGAAPVAGAGSMTMGPKAPSDGPTTGVVVPVAGPSANGPAASSATGGSRKAPRTTASPTIADENDDDQVGEWAPTRKPAPTPKSNVIPFALPQTREARSIYIHNAYGNSVLGRAANSRTFEQTPNMRLGARIADDYDDATRILSEFNTSPWQRFGVVRLRDKLSFKLDQVAKDLLLIRDGRIAGARWYFTEAPPPSLATALDDAEIPWEIVPLPPELQDLRPPP